MLAKLPMRENHFHSNGVAMFQDGKLQPSSIGGFRLAKADTLGNSPIKVSKEENLTVLDSFHGHPICEPLPGPTPAYSLSLNPLRSFL